MGRILSKKGGASKKGASQQQSTTAANKKGSNAGKKSKASAKSPFAVSGIKNNKKKPKEVKTNLKKIKANVKSQQEKSDATLKAIHSDIVVKKTTPVKKKVEKKKKTAPISKAATKATRKQLGKMQVD